MKKLLIELADTHLKRELGLMNRKSLSKNEGMLFKFPYSTRLSFWMKDTYIPLDIAFLDERGKILQIESMSPLSTRAIVSSDYCKYALEVNKGWFKENEIKVGNLIGGRGISCRHKLAQVVDPNAQPQQGDMSNPPAPAPDVTLNMSMKERLEEANLKKKTLVVIYINADGEQKGPKDIVPPFEFVANEAGHHDAIVKAWDGQNTGWISIIIKDIKSLEEREPEEKKESMQETTRVS